MTKRVKMPGKRHRGGKILLALCNLLGTLMLLAIIASCMLIILPQSKGYYVYHIISGSMAPEIPIGSIIYVEPVEPVDINPGDVIAFQSGEGVIAHRVVRNYFVEGEFSTKGDSNEVEDTARVKYGEVIGIVVRHYPYLGEILTLYSTGIGKVYIILVAACGAMLNIVANRFRARRKAQVRYLETVDL